VSEALSTAAERVQAILHSRGVEATVVELPASTRTAREAAQAIGCAVEQIAKSIVFRRAPSGEPLLVIASGTNRIDEPSLAAEVGERIEKADAAYVREATGFAIGGVPPVGHDRPIETLIDADLLDLDELWAAAGTPHAVFRLTPSQLLAATGGKVVRVAPGPARS
jgi:prolyl-tRNA editing enzyme YbaK/EbsC (Cys-tRNA(Pro) deacylase)